MSIFNLFGKKKSPFAGIESNPAYKSMELDFLQKELLNLMAVGRKDDALNVVMTFIKNFAKTSKGKASPTDLSRICAVVAHRILPDLFLRQHSDYQNYSKSPLPLNQYLLLKASAETEKSVDLTQVVEALKCSKHRLNADVSYFLVEYPEPPLQTEVISLEKLMASGKIPTLDMLPLQGPYFSFCGVNEKTGELLCYMLQQSASGSGTSMRCDAETWSGTINDTPPPTKEAFLASIRSRHGI